ncbi:hypothetical protein GCM10011321_31930 [Youhaiella tibetensis]|uniref:Uncharacterized protein n=1 Tax=Paradevosia tibetensis TaxID=1447062 RepID=A0A5B9DHW3_9HYPH|nr:hypothetical protein [Youhaiella tibetensis]QEE18850.1 hypothetical protein FNA67_01045 [Youhaiella tibetensis]GGF38590.1 hypothetical protein GCM10011321_31930 [Youhaiella tibetensis]
MSQRQERQRFIRHYKELTGETEIDMHKVAEFAKAQGWEMPQPPSDIELLARKFAEDAQAERRYDDTTGRPYRAYHALPVQSGQMNLFVYIDIDDATRKQMHKSAVHRREQIVSDGYQLTLDLDHWNSVHPEEQPIELPMDITLDIEIRKASDDEDKVA